MHPRRSAQDVLRCDSCTTAPLQSHCELCHINLCVNCVEKHVSDSSRRHKVVPFTQKIQPRTIPKCPKHGEKHCELYCEKCDIPVCSTCISDEHRGHIVCDVLPQIDLKTEALQNDLEELETGMYPQYKEMASGVQTEKAELETKYGKLTTSTDQQGEILHREITAIVNQRKSDIADMKTKHMAALDKNTDEIMHSITELQQMIVNLKAVLESNDISLISSYKSRNNEFRRLPPKVRVTLPSFSPQKINTEQLREIFGSLSSLSINTEEHDNTIKSLKAVSSPPVKRLLDEIRLTGVIDSRIIPRSVSCDGDGHVWICGTSKVMQLSNLRNKVLKVMETGSGNTPEDIAVTQNGDLIYTDYRKRTVNLVQNKLIRTVITLQGWKPLSVYCASSDDLLVGMISDDRRQYKVVRYSGSTETQTIQFDNQGFPLYSSDYNTKYISENRNLNICVADFTAKAVVVVKQSGKLRFRYTGHPSNAIESFKPRGITTDSQSHILIADKHHIHVLTQDGQFLRYIQTCHCHLSSPYGLYVDIRDNLFVAESNAAKVSVIQYLSSQC